MKMASIDGNEVEVIAMDIHDSNGALNAKCQSSPLVGRNESRVEDNESAIIKRCPTCCKVPSCLNIILPPRGKPAEYLTRFIACVVIWAALYSVIGKDAWPGGNIFSVYIILVAATLGGFCVSWKTRYFSFPPLLGMMIVGFMVRNISAINIYSSINPNWSSALRNIALCVILLRSGLGLDINALKRLKFTVVRLAFCPCLSEAITVAILARFLLEMPWLWAFQLGFILGAVSPAVVVPSMLSLQEDGYGTQEGIPTLVMAASSCDDVLAISLFGVFLGIAFSEGDIYFNIFRGPLEIVMGISAGLLIGMLLWYIPWRRSEGANGNRCVLIVVFALMLLFGSSHLEFPGAGALSVLCLGATAGYGWGDKGKEPVEKVMSILWTIFQPLLFGLIGAEVSIQYLDKSLVGKGIATLFIGLIIRCIVTFFAVSGCDLNVKEKLFCVISWLPKATVQAAIGSIPLDTARRLHFEGKEEEKVGIQIVTIAVLVILITAPLGAIGISLSGPKWLKKKIKESE